MSRIITKLGAILLGIGLFMAGFYYNSDGIKTAKFAKERKVKKVILMIPDGYSAGYATNYRWFKGSDVIMDKLLVGMVKTFSADNKVTDSAAAGTAMATGLKTNNGMISETSDGRTAQTILEAARKAGKSAGLVVTSTITHATPAVFAAHVNSRDSEADIAPQMLERVEVLFGGGKEFFLPEALGGKQKERNLIKEAQAKGYTIIEDKNQLQGAKGKKLLGLFANNGMAPELDRDATKEPSLAEMTNKALATLNKDKDGFFLMVEGSQIDWAGHNHDPAWAMKDTEAFEGAVKAALEFATNDGHTLVVVVGDHDTGGFSVGGYDKYEANVEILRKVTATGNYMVTKLNSEGNNIKEIVKTYTEQELSDDEVNLIKTSSNQAHTINDIISQRALVSWTTFAHTGTDIPLYAYGVGEELFEGLHDNTDIPKLIAKVMNIQFRSRK